MRAGYTTYADYWHFTLPLLVQGVAMSTFFLAMLTISLGGIPPERTPRPPVFRTLRASPGAALPPPS
jgi:hypothetical protein